MYLKKTERTFWTAYVCAGSYDSVASQAFFRFNSFLYNTLLLNGYGVLFLMSNRKLKI